MQHWSLVIKCLDAFIVTLFGLLLIDQMLPAENVALTLLQSNVHSLDIVLFVFMKM